ncbi:hypothetical protein [Streptomyces sp. NPDC086519]|uniref:hypothetical protein n=1 Tax=Streptomyces sp. NPDC086519 TaxID=3154863 RepID=UPI00341EC6FB
MGDVRDGVIGVWWVGWSGRLMGYVLAAGPACGALSAWLGVLSHPGTQSVSSAGIATAVALGSASSPGGVSFAYAWNSRRT